MASLLESKVSLSTGTTGTQLETALLNQFHDILPGSSIKEVYEDSAAQYEEILLRMKK